jgi:hypothetical protein
LPDGAARAQAVDFLRVAVARGVGVNQTGIPLGDILIQQLEFFARRMWGVDDQGVLDRMLEGSSLLIGSGV